MLLQSKDGIACDFCANRYKEKFMYYSLKATEFQVRGTQKLPGTNPKYNKDMCSVCYGELVEEVMRHIGVHKNGSIKDDLSDKYGTGNFSYWVVVFDRVEVDKEQPEGSQITVENHVLDLNLVDYKKFKERSDKIEKQLEKTGAWS